MAVLDFKKGRERALPVIGDKVYVGQNDTESGLAFESLKRILCCSKSK